jgi:uncharacterized protein YndB with AHSA1/START domain
VKLLKWLGVAVLVPGLLVLLVALAGFSLPQDHVATRSATFNKPVAEVWNAITDVEAFPRWRSGISRVEVLAREPRRWREHGSDEPITFQIVESHPPVRLVSEIADTGLPFGGRWIYELKSTGTGTELTITERGEVYNPVFRFVSRFVMGHTATIEAYLGDLAKALR